MDEIAATVTRTGLSEAFRQRNPAIEGLFRELIASNDPSAYADWAAATADAEMIEPDRVTCPVLACCGEHDPVAPREFAEAIGAAVPNGRVQVVRGAAHWCQIEAPEPVNEMLLSFLEEIAT